MKSTKIRKLRESLKRNLKRLINNPTIEAKELAAFDLLMNRRQFLKTVQFIAIGALVDSAFPPTAWGRFDKKLHINPQSVGLTPSDVALVSAATHVITGTELFQDTVYAQPVVATDVVNTHALIEGTRSRLRIQSDLLSNNPDEYTFLDGDYHIGPPELIQAEQNDTGEWEIVHYYYPKQPRTDGARTDSLERHVISGSSTFSNVTKVLAITGTFTNRFSSQGTGQTSSANYAVFVQTDENGFFFLGTANWSVTPPYVESPDYNISWAQHSIKSFFSGSYGQPTLVDKYTSSAWVSPSKGAATAYAPEQQVEHLVFYYDGDAHREAYVFTLADTGAGLPDLIFTNVPYNADELIPRVVHIDWNPTQDGHVFTNIVLASTRNNSDGSVTYYLYSVNKVDPYGNSNVSGNTSYPFGDYVGWNVFFETPTKYQIHHSTISYSALQNGTLAVDYSKLRSVLGLHTTSINNSWYHVKLVNFEGRGAFLMTIIKEYPPNEVQTADPFFLGGLFPLAFPDAAGLGTITALSGGTSKFGGFRYVASDSDGNVFLMRQRRSASANIPYPNPIYAQYTADGQLKSKWNPTPDALPAGVSPSSNLNDLQAWIDASGPAGLNYVYNLLLYAALAFGTDDSNQSQAVWLGNTYQAAYASKRFALDSEHVVIKQILNGDTDQYAAFTMFNVPLTKTWHERQIATQKLPETLGTQETGDHYQATVAPANTYGKPVSLLTADNSNLMIEVRADSPCTVIDDTNNHYYDVDAYTSFMAPPDPATGHLCLLVKAESFSQVLYVRLVDTSGLQPSKDDAALLTSTNVNSYAWQSVNLALQAQARMGNGAPPSALLGNAKPIMDTAVYITGDTLYQNNQNAPWKGNYNQQDMQANLANMATYLNTSGQNLISATGQLSLGASPDGVTINPLYAVTSVPLDESRNTVTTQFAYNAGLVNTTTSDPSTSGQLGSLWSSISHDLHDALHWLQHVEGQVYNELASGGVTIVSAVDSITVTVGKDIMKQVNGVEQELNEVVTTVEEYASIVANLVVTIVESSFIYIFIEAIIALISLFLHFKDILQLSNSLNNQFHSSVKQAEDGSASFMPPSTFSSWNTFGSYLGTGSGSQIDSTLNGVDSTSVPSELSPGLLDAVSGNPLTKKIINKLSSAVSALMNKVDPPLPLNFDMDQTSSIQKLVQDTENLQDSLIISMEKMTVDIGITFIDALAADIANPQQTYNNLASQAGTMADVFLHDGLYPLFHFVDTYTKNAPAFALDLIDYNAYMTLDIQVLIDLCKLFKIGSPSNSKLNLETSEAVFFPLALIAWVSVYMHTGKSIKSVDDLDGEWSPAPAGQVTGAKLWDVFRLAADLVLTELIGISFLVNALQQPPEPSVEPTSIQKLSTAVGSWINLARWTSDLVYLVVNYDPAKNTPADYVWVGFRFTTAVVDTIFTLPKAGLNPPRQGWPRNPTNTQVTQCVNAVLNLAMIVVDPIVNPPDKSTASIVSFIGKETPRCQIFVPFVYGWSPTTFKSYLLYFYVAAFGLPLGFALQAWVAGGGLSALPPSGPGNTSSGPGRRRRRRRRPNGTGQAF